MADIRIKDLTTTASSTASDDFIAVDGTTNGTRKLNAFSPTFGGNATVTGTLTANGNIVAGGNVICGSATNQSVSLAGGTANDGGNIIVYGSTHASDPNTGRIRIGTTTIALWDSNDFSVASGKGLKVLATTASTSTSSGALVVSGGVGVAGAIYAGGLLSSSATTSLDGLPTAGIFGGTKRVALGYNTSGDYGFVACADSGTTWKELHLNPLGGLVKVPQSTASNDAYTGAFVVGGGVGAAGAVNAGTFFGLVDGVTAPATGSGYARIYVDSADGDLKVKFGDGTVKTIATDS
jgi:hypothetical protein